jgi:hypothetical protein
MNKGRVITVVFKIEDNDKFMPVWDSMKWDKASDMPALGAKALMFAEGHRVHELERQLNIWQEFGSVDNYQFNNLFDELKAEHNWNDDDWGWNESVEQVAKVWQPEE